MADYNIRSIFEEMELELIRSMKRNLSRHMQWEKDEEMNWTMWQAEQLKTLEQFKRENEKIFGKKFSIINKEIEEFLKDTYEISGLEQEKEILNAIKDNKKFKDKYTKGLEGSFFQLNEDKMNALINATTKDLPKAEHAMLRMVNDQYRKTIFKAEVMANSGAFTLQQSIDMATKDFLKAGINCIEYKNGRRVNIASYAEMCIRTATKRAALISEGDVRNAYGIHTVRISKYGGCSETCLPWQGKVYVDNVYSGGTKEEAKEKNVPLLSEAIAGGLFHPNCKHRSTTYFYDLKKELGELKEDGIENPIEEQEHKKNHLHIQQQKRLEQGSLDSQNIEQAKNKKIEWIEKDKNLGYLELMYSYKESASIEEAQEFASQFFNTRLGDKTFKGIADYKGLSLEHANEINKTLAVIYGKMDISKISGIKAISPTSAAGKKVFKNGADAIASYDPIQHGIYINKDILKNDKTFKEYIQKSEDAWKTVMSNMEQLSDSQKELAMTYKKAGRSLVDGKSINGVITHEMGHHVQWDVLDTKTNNSIGSKMSQYAPKISGYANSTKGEYIAESFVAYMNGERDILDSEFVEFLDVKNITKPGNHIDEIIEEIKNLTEHEEHALKQYISSESYKINDKLRRGLELTENDKNLVENLNKALDKMPIYEATVIRDLTFMYEEDIVEFMEIHKEGKIIPYASFTSSTKNKTYSDNAQVRLIIESKSGRDVSKYNEKEAEVLFKTDCSFKVLKIEEKDDIIILYMSEE